ncbi:polysaccharide biosynthesis protein [Lysinibacillus alkalisoli]|uniref:Polysaccharide biosynthesis protein n=1 Tax=Lysinibacillus alkalisoli TaxID=1911548 RepID=A0A917FYQ1_9BACI|nr:Wzz/FepE/Etk N-terminal domain-containing protein [Lysinibacillus alkalisoli]GGG14431.1 polysaccharide biosynthesis protein [Lysinibacillus alkalisoli]
MESTFSMEELLLALKKRWSLLVLLALIGIAFSAVLTFVVITPKYEAMTQLLINKQKEENVTQYQATQNDLQLMNTYIAILKSDVILEDVAKEIDFIAPIQQLRKKIAVSSEENSKVLNIYVRDQNASFAVDTANAIATIFTKEIGKLMDVDNVQVLAEAKVKNSLIPVSPNHALNLVLGAVIGALFGIVLNVLFILFNNKFKSEKELELELGVPVIGVINKMPNVTTQRNLWQRILRKGGE